MISWTSAPGFPQTKHLYLSLLTISMLATTPLYQFAHAAVNALDFLTPEMYNMSMDLSIVLGTYNRFAHLMKCISTIREFVKCEYEIIIADGGSIEGSREWMAKQKDVIMIGERSLSGAVDAYNKAFSIASGKFVAHLNDDCHL